MLRKLDDFAALEGEWRQLESVAGGSFFQSWGWIGCWLETLPTELQPQLLRVHHQDASRGLGLLVGNTIVRHRLLRSRGLFLHETGRPELDCLTIEHNGLLAEESRVEDLAVRAFEELCRHEDWDELFIGGVDLETAMRYRRAAANCALRVHEVDRKPWYAVDLGRVRDAGDFLALLSGNSRYQIRRSMRDYEQAGPLQVTVARTRDEARQCFDRLAGLHQASWRSRGQTGAFARDHFCRFHRRLIEREFASGTIQLSRICAGEQEIGYLYNFVHHGRVYAYQSGFAYANDGKRKPGLVCHALAVSLCARQGLVTYDLLAGDSQYKRTLATGGGEMVWLSLQRPRMRFRLEHRARRLRDAWRRLGRTRRAESSDGS